MIVSTLLVDMKNGNKEVVVVFYSIALLVNLYMFFGALSMRRLDSLTWARWACGLSLVVHMGCCLIFGPIFGTWGLFVLAEKDVKQAFRR